MGLVTLVPQQKEFTVVRAAALLDRTPATIYRWIDEGFLKAERRPKNHVVIPRAALLAVLEQHAITVIS
jgi:excisionase family DNA binding protein